MNQNVVDGVIRARIVSARTPSGDETTLSGGMIRKNAPRSALGAGLLDGG
jgi:hypothetical protein